MKKFEQVPLLIEVGLGIEGRFKVETKKVGSDVLELRADWQDNLITNIGLNKMGTSTTISNWMYTVAVGSGSTPPAFTDTGLVAKVAQADYNGLTDVSGHVEGATPYGWFRRSYQFPVGAAAGNLSELGIKDYTNDNIVNTRALIKDSGGNPTTITVLADEILVITYEVRLYVDMTDKTYNQTIKGNATTITVRPAQISAANSWFGYNQAMRFSNYVWGATYYHGGTGLGVGPTSGVPSGTTVTYSNVQKTSHPYVDGSYKLEDTINFGINDGVGLTFTGVLGMSCAVPFQVGFSPGWLKTNAETVKLRMAVTWGRYSP